MERRKSRRDWRVPVQVSREYNPTTDSLADKLLKAAGLPLTAHEPEAEQTPIQPDNYYLHPPTSRVERSSEKAQRAVQKLVS